MLQLLPILPIYEDNQDLLADPACKDTLRASVDYYGTIGFYPPWICYIASKDKRLVGGAGIKGRPVNNKIEIAYGTFPEFQRQGIGTEICAALVSLALNADPGVIVTARTLPENNYSVRILEKNGFRFLSPVWDKDDGDVWEWQYDPA